jgi:hypothetical protein
MDSELRRIGSVSLSILLLLWIVGNTVPQLVNVTIPSVYGASLPSDQDAWTENNNATYPWTCPAGYKDTIGFATTDKAVGSYSLNINHTQATTEMYFSLDLGSQTNFTSYDFISFRIKIVRAAGWTNYFTLDLGDTAPFSGARKRISIFMQPQQWNKAVFPLDAFRDASGTPSWTNRRYVAFSVYGFTSADNARVYIDGMYFGNWMPITETATLDEKMLPNFDSFLHRWQKTQTYNGKSYTSSWSMVPVSGATEGNPELESEVLPQIIFALSLAYNYTQHQYYLDFAKPYVDWLLQFQWLTNPNDVRYGGFWGRYSSGFTYDASPTNQGWILASLSLYHSVTANATVKIACDRLASHMMDKMWNSTNNWFDSVKMSNGAKIYTTTWQGMPQGAMATGLSTYYKYVTQNSTVKTILDKLLNKGLTLAQFHNFYCGTDVFEDTTYAWWGMYYAYLAFNNATYYNDALHLAKLMRTNYEIQGNSEPWYRTYMVNTTGGYNGWGYACALPLLFKLYEKEQDNNYLELFKNALLNVIPSIQTGNYSITRKRLSGDDWINWQPPSSNAFIVATLAQYYSQIYKPTNPYLLSTDKEIIASSYADNKFTFTVSAPSGTTSTTKVYVGDKGEPKRVLIDNIDQPVNYNFSTKIVTITATHASNPPEIVVDWNTYPPEASFVYLPFTPYANGTVSFNASGSRPNGGYLISYTWDFGDGNTTTVTTPAIVHVYASYGPYNVTLNVTDNEGLWNSTTAAVSVRMPAPPSVWNVEYTPEHPEYNESVTITANITSEESGIGVVILSYFNGSEWTNMTMAMKNGLYVVTILGLHYGTTVRYKVYASNDFGNWAETDTFSFTVTDTIPPDVGPVRWSPREPSEGEEVVIYTQVSEPLFASGVKKVTLLWVAPGMWTQSSTMIMEDDVWKATIPGQSGGTLVFFAIESYDNAGNHAKSQWYSYRVKVARAVSPLLILASIAATVTVLTGVTIYVVRRKKVNAARARGEVQ